MLGVSADNGIYILQTKDQYRIAHLMAIDNVFWSYNDGCLSLGSSLVPARVVEMWGSCRYTRSRKKAFKIAYRWAESLPVCEYGVKIITYNKKWKHILRDAEVYGRKEPEVIR